MILATHEITVWLHPPHFLFILISTSVKRTDAAFLNAVGTDPMTYLIPPDGRVEALRILPSDLICSSTQRVKGAVTIDSPMLKSRPGSSVALGYQENGHITGTSNPLKLTSGAVSVYGTSNSEASDALLGIHHVWNANGTGGDKRGVLLGRSNFDDGSCYQVRNTSLSIFRQGVPHRPLTSTEGTNLWCRSIVVLPEDVPTGSIYTLYWVWDWPSIEANGFLNKPEIYTTCVDVEIVSEVPVVVQGK